MEFSGIHEIMEHMIHTEHMHKAVCDRELSRSGLYRAQFRMLMHLWHNGGKLPQRRLAEELHISPAVVTVTLKKLLAEGYVTRIPSEQDRRTVMIALTPHGNEAVDTAHGTLDRIDTAMLDGFTDEEKEKLVSYYNRMLFNLMNMKEGLE